MPYFEAAGWRSTHRTVDQPWARDAADADVVVVHRWRPRRNTLKKLRKLAGRLIFDFDDAIFRRDDGSFSLNRRLAFRRTLRVCDQVWAGNAYLAAAAKNICSDVREIPTAVAVDRYEQTSDPRGPIDPAAPVRLVWIGSSATRRYLEAILPALEAAARERKGELVLRTISDFALSTGGLKLESYEWSSQTEVSLLAGSDIGLAPMADNAFTRGKCGLKTLQYMAVGLPVIAADAGVHRQMVRDQKSGRLVGAPADWTAAVRELAANAKLRETMGHCGRQIVGEHYDLSVVADRMVCAIETLMAR